MNGEETRLIASQADRRERFAKIVLTRSYLEAKVSWDQDPLNKQGNR